MLVLALQFSKGGASGGAGSELRRRQVAHWQRDARPAVEAGSSMPGAEEGSAETPSKRKRRQGCRVRLRTEDESYDDRARVPTAHQCTNWERTLDCRTNAGIDERSAP